MMASFLSTKQIEMLRDDLARLQCPNDDDQIEAIRTMCNALDNNDEATFKTTWKRLKVGYGTRIGVCEDQFSQQHGGSAKPPHPQELIPEARNHLSNLQKGLDNITAQANDDGTARSATKDDNG